MQNTIKKAILVLSLIVLTSSLNFTKAIGNLPPTASEIDTKITVFGKELKVQKNMGKPYIDSDTLRIMVPIRAIVEKLNAEIYYAKPQGIEKAGFIIKNNDTIIKLLNGENSAQIIDKNGKKFSKELDQSMIIYDGRSYVPIRFITETLGYNLTWTKIGNIHNIVINTDSNVNPLPDVVVPIQSTPPQQKQGENLLELNNEELNQEFLGLLNDYRLSKGLGPIRRNTQMNDFAVIRSIEEQEDYHRTGDISHERPNGLQNPYAENIAYTFRLKDESKLAEKFLTMWQNSPDHNENLLHPELTQGAFAVSRLKGGGYFGVYIGDY